MLHKQYRLPATTRLGNATTFTTHLFILKVKKNDLTHNRFGFVVRKTVDKRATERNRIRRVFRSCIEEMLPQFSLGHDMLFLLKRPILEMERDALYNEVHSFFREKHLLT
jgi:ribonuclease P protein component